MANKKTRIIRRERREMTDEKRVARALVKCQDVFNEEHLNFTDPSRAVTIQPDDPLYQGEEITMLLMPMLVND